MDVKTRKILIPCVIIALMLFVIGIIIGYFAAPRRTPKASTSGTCSLTEAVQASCPVDRFTDIGKRYLKRYVYEQGTIIVSLCLKQFSLKIRGHYNNIMIKL